ncbi:g861 [Coccomyxa elongata]
MCQAASQQGIQGDGAVEQDGPVHHPGVSRDDAVAQEQAQDECAVAAARSHQSCQIHEGTMSQHQAHQGISAGRAGPSQVSFMSAHRASIIDVFLPAVSGRTPSASSIQDDDQVDAMRLNARSVEQAAALARAGVVVQPELPYFAPAPGYLGVQTPSQAPMPNPAPSAVDGTLKVGTPGTAPASADTIAEVPQHAFDDLGATVASLPLYPGDGYGL